MKNIVIIEDDELIASIYQNQLQREGYAVEVTHDGEQGLSRVNELRPDGVLLDLMVPKISGLEILQRIRAQNQFQNLPVIVFSNSFVPSMLQKARDAGASKIFNKASARPAEMVAAFKSLCPPIELATGTAIAPKASGASVSEFLSNRAGVAKPVQPTGAEDTALHNKLRDRCLGGLPGRLAELRKLFQDAVKTGSAGLVSRQEELRRSVHALTGQAGLIGLTRAAQLCSALEAMLKELGGKPKYVNPSSLRTVAQTLDLLEIMLPETAEAETEPMLPPLILVVDDDIISRQAVRSALDKAGLRSLAVEDPELALRLCRENKFDLVLSDVDMPVVNGFEFCQKLRSLPGNEKVPFIFVTGLSDFEARTRSILSGGNDLIGKPFLLIELAVKALTHVLKHQLLAA